MGVTRIPLDDETHALVDTADMALLGGFNWRSLSLPGGHVYVHAWHGKLHFYMHRFLLGVADAKIEVDHRNGNGLDNRRSNLRSATRSQNLANSGRRTARGDVPQSRYKGVYWDRSRERWAAHICVNGKRRALGRFHDEDEAGRVYDQAALEAWGEFARLNFEVMA